MPPLATPPSAARLRVLHALAVASVVAAASLVAPALYECLPGPVADRPAGVLALCTGALTLVLARYALRATTAAQVVGRALGHGALLGALDAVVTICTLSFVAPGPGYAAVSVSADAGVVLLVALAATLIGAPLGAVFGGAALLAFAPVVRARTQPSADAGEGVLAGAGATLVLGGVVARAAARGAPLRDAGVALATLGLAALMVALVTDVRRRAWLDRVRQGRVDGLRERSRRGGLDARERAPVFAEHTLLQPDAVIEQRVGAETTPFREPEAWLPVALSHTEGSGGEFHAVGRGAYALIGAILVLAAWSRA